MKRGGCSRNVAASRVTAASLAASCRAIAAGASCASANMRVLSTAITLLVWLSVMGSFGLQFGDKIVGIAAIERRSEFDDAAVIEEGAALDCQCRAAGGQVQQARLRCIQR